MIAENAAEKQALKSWQSQCRGESAPIRDQRGKRIMKKEKIKFPLGRKIAFMAIALALCLSIQMIVFNYLNYRDEMFEHMQTLPIRWRES